jgi:hypothetical protein
MQFPTKLAAVKNKKVGEEGPPLNARDTYESLVTLNKKKAKAYGVTGLQQTHVLQGTSGLGGVCQAFFFRDYREEYLHQSLFCRSGGRGEEVACHIAAKAVAYTDRQLRKYRSSSQSSVQEAPFHPSDLTACAFCGKDDSGIHLKSCSCCNLARYCSAECQPKAAAEGEGTVGTAGGTKGGLLAKLGEPIGSRHVPESVGVYKLLPLMKSSIETIRITESLRTQERLLKRLYVFVEESSLPKQGTVLHASSFTVTTRVSLRPCSSPTN